MAKLSTDIKDIQVTFLDKALVISGEYKSIRVLNTFTLQEDDPVLVEICKSIDVTPRCVLDVLKQISIWFPDLKNLNELDKN